MAIIDKYRNILTVLEVFDIPQEKSQDFIENTKVFYQEYVKQCPGHISMNLHLNLEQNKIINYAQWRSEEDYQSFLNDKEIQNAGKEILGHCSTLTQMKVVFAS